jgi:antitoxin component of MazEF toxin-antitoxin module
MPYPTKIQLICRKSSEQFYVNLPAGLAHAMDFSKGEQVRWSVHDRGTLVLERPHAPPSPLKKTTH